MGMLVSTPEAKAKKRLRHAMGIRDFQNWMRRQPKPPAQVMKFEMFDFFIDEAAKKK
jgi:hypothetical protein